MLENSVLVSAHPDDEVLWFSSILDRVNGLVFCYLDWKSRPDVSLGRKKSLSQYPMNNISCLAVDESEAFNGANWQNPVITKYGIEISNKRVTDKKYVANYYELKRSLKNELTRYHNIVTHNPWGEYGNEDHIQVYRVVKELQKEMEFTLWFSNYCSNKSFDLMRRYVFGHDYKYVTLKTNKVLSNIIKHLYQKNGCWTWYDDWEWFNEESFIKDNRVEKQIDKYGPLFPLNLIKIKFSSESNREVTFFSKFFARISQRMTTLAAQKILKR